MKSPKEKYARLSRVFFRPTPTLVLMNPQPASYTLCLEKFPLTFERMKKWQFSNERKFLQLMFSHWLKKLLDHIATFALLQSLNYMGIFTFSAACICYRSTISEN